MTEKHRQRCGWVGINNPEYTRYHDEEWSVPHADDRLLFEKLNLEAFQSGLSWLTILKKRENFRAAFDNFDPERIARYGKRDLVRLMSDPGIVRNQRKIEATILNAKAYLEISKTQSFSHYLWDFLDGRPIVNRRKKMSDVPAKTEQSTVIAKALKRVGFHFVGPTTVYAFMQSVGMVNDHLVSCWRHKPCATLQSKFRIHQL
ncbi:MAG: DNA-3-methyladenine glycosylase I [Hyphomicrobiaceae bacterium]